MNDKEMSEVFVGLINEIKQANFNLSNLNGNLKDMIVELQNNTNMQKNSTFSHDQWSRIFFKMTGQKASVDTAVDIGTKLIGALTRK